MTHPKNKKPSAKHPAVQLPANVSKVAPKLPSGTDLSPDDPLRFVTWTTARQMMLADEEHTLLLTVQKRCAGNKLISREHRVALQRRVALAAKKFRSAEKELERLARGIFV